MLRVLQRVPRAPLSMTRLYSSLPQQRGFESLHGKRVYTRAEVARHNTDEDLWVVIDGRVYDLSQWINFHPGGRDALIEAAGSDATELFNEVGHSQEARERMEEFQLGVVATETRFTASEYAERPGEV